MENEPVVPPVEPNPSAPEWGSSSAVPEWGSGTHASSSTGAGWVPTYTPSELMSWNSGVRNTCNQEAANRWQESARLIERTSRSEEMEGGRSPPPKLAEENLFSEGDSRLRPRPTYAVKESRNNWGWDDNLENTKEETISDIFEEISQGHFNANKKRRRFEYERKPWKGHVEMAAYVEDDEEDVDSTHVEEEHVAGSSVVEPSPTRRDCVMGTSEALNKLTRDNDENEEEAEWLIIKATKRGTKEVFMVDYCDGDAEDEFQ